MKKEFSVFENIPQILDKLTRGGILVTAKVGDKVNPITIGWGTIGVQWGKPIFQVYIRESRYTKSMLDEALNFTVNIPLEKSDRVKEILAFCGTKSGRDLDKVKELNLSLVPSEKIDAPAISELPMTIECNVIYKERQNYKEMPADVLQRFYPDAVQNPNDVHTVYYGEIVSSYILQ